MLDYMEYLGMSASAIGVLVVIFLISKGSSEVIDAKNKILPEWLNFKKRREQRRLEREALSKLVEKTEKDEEMYATVRELKTFLETVNQHYSDDNIAKRDGWMQGVNGSIAELKQRQDEQEARYEQLGEKLDKNTEITLSTFIDNKRDFLLDFTSKAVDMTYPMTKEQYNRFFTVHSEYEKIIEENNMTNGQVTAAFSIVTKSFEERLKKHAFIEEHEYGYNT